jgi:very-short-patch-repair endonuclease
MSSYKKNYFSEEQRKKMWDEIHLFPERVRNEILQSMFEVAYDALQFKLIYQCESPIEQLMHVAISTNIVEWMTRYNLPITFGPQHEVTIGTKKYRVDFMIEIMDCIAGKPMVQIAVECDGHNFHEKTKEQAQRDKLRDRELQAKGIIVLRFTGSEIYNETYICLRDIEKVLERFTDRNKED